VTGPASGRPDPRRPGGAGHDGTVPRSRPPLTRELVLAAALELADAEGLAAVSMRRLSAVLGVEAMSLYHHVRDKQDLLNGMNMLLLSRIAAEPVDEAWPRVLTTFAERLYGTYLRHPELARVLEGSTPTSPEVLAGMDRVFAALAETGLPPTQQVSAFRGLVAMCLGFVLVHAGRDRRAGERPWSGWDTGAMTATAAPRLPRVAGAMEATPHEADFRFMLTMYIDALRRMSAATRQAGD
jgi:TetR/AcrR family tetracycline transcriptional repressor